MVLDLTVFVFNHLFQNGLELIRRLGPPFYLNVEVIVFQWHHPKENVNKELMIQIDGRQSWYLYFTYQSWIFSEDAKFLCFDYHIWFGNSWVKTSGDWNVTPLHRPVLEVDDSWASHFSRRFCEDSFKGYLLVFTWYNTTFWFQIAKKKFQRRKLFSIS